MSASEGDLLRVMSLHALAYCERLFYLEEVEEIRVADERVYSGRTLHEELDEGEEERKTFELASETIGLVGKLDGVRVRDVGWVPYEHKRGRPARTKEGVAEAWPSDSLQVSAYGMLLEEAVGRPVREGRVRYHAENITVRVPLDVAARERVIGAVARARKLRESLDRPPVAANERLCVRCSLAPVCLPEEERLAADPDWEPVRLFPPNVEGKVIHITTHGSHVGRSDQRLKVEGAEIETVLFPIQDVHALVIHGNAQVTTQALHLCASNGVAVHWLTGGGFYVGALSHGPGPVQRRLRQFQALSDPAKCLALAKKLAHSRAEGQMRFLLRATRGADRSDSVRNAFIQIRNSLRAIPGAENTDSVRGHEGIAARAYFGVLPELVGKDIPGELRPDGRSRRPPRDPFNALLSFGYALLYRSVLEAVLVVGLEPSLGFYHTARSSAHPLALDLMELFRTPIWDVAVLGSVNRKQWDPDVDFTRTRQQVWLSDSGRKKAIQLFERRLADTWKHPVTDYSLSYGRTIELEVRLLEKEWTGEPGLFARARLR